MLYADPLRAHPDSVAALMYTIAISQTPTIAIIFQISMFSADRSFRNCQMTITRSPNEHFSLPIQQYEFAAFKRKHPKRDCTFSRVEQHITLISKFMQSYSQLCRAIIYFLMMKNQWPTVAQHYLQACSDVARGYFTEQAGFALQISKDNRTWRLYEQPNEHKYVIWEGMEGGDVREEGGVGLGVVEESRREGKTCVDAADCLTEACQVQNTILWTLCLLLDQLLSSPDPYGLAVEWKVYLCVVQYAFQHGGSLCFNLNHLLYIIQEPKGIMTFLTISQYQHFHLNHYYGYLVKVIDH